MNFLEFRPAQQSWNVLLRTLEQYAQNQSLARTQVEQACADLESKLLSLGQLLKIEGRQDDARRVLSMTQALSSGLSAVLDAQNRLEASNRLPARINLFGTFLDSMALSDSVKRFLKSANKMHELFLAVSLGLDPDSTCKLPV